MMEKPKSTRREFVKLAGTALVGSSVAGSALAQSKDVKASGPVINVAGYHYDRTRAISDGVVGIDGSNVSFSYENIYALNKSVYGPEQKYAVTEIGFIPYVNQYINNGFRDYTLIPVFISRTFRHRNIYVHVDSGIEKPEDLRGKRVGTPGYGFSSHTWIRGMLADVYGIKASDMHWIETTASSDGGQLNTKSGLNKYYFDKDFPIEQGPPGVDESQLLLSGGCDALITAVTPKAFEEGNPKIRQLFSNVTAAEKNYYEQTRVFPLMHAVAIRTDLVKENPNLPRAVFTMYSEAKRKAFVDMQDTTSLRVSLPWISKELEDTRAFMGDNFWSYGVKANQKELELITRYVYEQGLAKRKIDYKALFHESTLELLDNPVG